MVKTNSLRHFPPVDHTQKLQLEKFQFCSPLFGHKQFSDTCQSEVRRVAVALLISLSVEQHTD